MIGLERQNELFLNISKKLKKKITCYAIGGTAMMFLELKQATKDIDLVFDNVKDREYFIEALISLGYSKIESRILYGKKPNQPELMVLDDDRIDLFLTEVISFIFSEESKKRIKTIREFAPNLIIKVADASDIFLMKSATEREKDIDDAKAIIDDKKINWDIILKEVKNQIQLGKLRAGLDLGVFLENLEAKGIEIPKKIKDDIWDMVKVVAESKIRKK
jgi:hypothetical protein